MLTGKVVKGARRKIGFTTANIVYMGQLHGVYAVYVHIDGRKYSGVANIGYAPTFGRRKKMLEVHILRFKENIIGKRIDVKLVKKLRNEKKFASADELTRQIKKDVKRAKSVLA